MYVEMKNINKNFGKLKVTDNINVSIEKGKLVGLLGPSGSGKTTLLRMIAGLETPDSGEIYINGKCVNDVSPSKREIGFVFQNYALFQNMTVYDNIAFGLKVKKWDKPKIKERVNELIKLTGLEGREKHYPSQLSGGQKQRVAFARALAPNPSVLLLDEPFAAIDAKIRTELRSWLKEMVQTLGITSIFVTHDQDEAIEVADKIIVTNGGKIEHVGTPRDIYRHPKTAFVAKFFGKGVVVPKNKNLVQFSNINDSEKIIRPEFIKLTKKSEFQKYSLAVTEAIVKEVTFRGDYLEITVDCDGTILIAKRSIEDEPIVVGEKVNIFIEKIWVITDNTVRSEKNPAMTEEYVVI